MKESFGLDLLRKQRRVFAAKVSLTLLSAAVVCALSFISVKFVRNRLFDADSVDSMYKNWALHTTEGYEKVYETSQKILEKKPHHNAALAFLGYSSFMLAESETDNMKSAELLDRSIFSLRKAMRDCKGDALPQLQYMLGRAYFYKNKISSYHYYADLAVKYLQLSSQGAFRSDDVPLLLGLSYASLGMTDESIASFTEALLVRETDTLLFNIAKQYCDNGQEAVAKQYLARVIETSENEELLDDSHILLGQIYVNESKFDDAQQEFNSVLEKNDNSADAHYGLGVLYEKKGDSAKARAEWRKCLKIQFNHPLALQKMS